MRVWRKAVILALLCGGLGGWQSAGGKPEASGVPEQREHGSWAGMILRIGLPWN